MKYLSRVLMDKRLGKWPKDGYAWHKLIWEAFPGRAGEQRDFLFRVDDLRHTFRIYLLSSVKPQAPAWGRWETKEIAAGFLEHARYRFQIKVNPTMRRAGDKRRLGLFDPEGLHAWMRRKAEAAGFEIAPESLVVGASIEYRFIRQGRMGKHIGVDFKGVLNVKNRDDFQKAFAQGIGSAKAFGFGLLLLQPLNES